MRVALLLWWFRGPPVRRAESESLIRVESCAPGPSGFRRLRSPDDGSVAERALEARALVVARGNVLEGEIGGVDVEPSAGRGLRGLGVTVASEVRWTWRLLFNAGCLAASK